MPLTLTIDHATWRAHQRAVLADVPGLVPVAKGNGYGFGNALLAAESAELGVDTIAVGVAQEVPEVRAVWAGDIVVLNPWRPSDAAAADLSSRIRASSPPCRGPTTSGPSRRPTQAHG